MNRKIRDLFFLLIRVALYENISLCEEDLASLTDDMRNQLYRLSQNQDMSHLLGLAFQKLGLPIDTSSNTHFEEDMFLALIRRENIEYELQRFDTLMTELGFPYLPLKGAAIAQLYPQAWMRTSCDIDILIHPEHLDVVSSALVDRLHYQKTGETVHDVSYCSESSVHIELHFALFDDPSINELYSDIWDNVYFTNVSPMKATLPLSYFMYFHIGHIAKHFELGGIGVRPVLDTFLLCAQPDFDEKTVLNLCERASLKRLFQVLYQLSRVWFEVDNHTEFTQSLEDFIFSGGIYGTIERHVYMERHTQSRAQYLLKRIFASRAYLCTVYPKLKVHPLLLPWYQLCRWCRIFTKNTSTRAANEIKWSNKTNALDDELLSLITELNIFNHHKKD